MRRFSWRPPRVVESQNTLAGYWRVIVYPRRAGYPSSIDISHFRDQEVKVRGFSTSDPFGPKAATLQFPQITFFDRLGEGDLWWLRPFADVELRWVGPVPSTYAFGQVNIRRNTAFTSHVAMLHPTAPFVPGFSWYGRIEPFDLDRTGLTLALKGMLYTGDDYLAKPAYPHSPLPYEWAIYTALIGHPHLTIKPPTIVWPSWWNTFYTPPKRGTPSYLIPQAVHPGAPWSGLVTRDTGKWEPVVSSYLQNLLASWYTARGRWTLDLFVGMQPVLFHREITHTPDANTIECEIVDPDTDLKYTEDWSQSIGAAFGQGTSLAGNVYSGMHVTPDGMLTEYNPLAALRQVHPENYHNDWLDTSRARKEILLQLQPGLSELEAASVAASHIARFGEPGKVGTLTLKTDPKISDGAGGWMTLPKALVRAGMSIHVPYVGGKPEGILAHVTDSDVDLIEETNTLSFDTKYRDALTVSEVRKRGRDALSIQRMLQVGVYEPPLPDQLVPWDYATGSGYIPSYSTSLNSQRLFDGMPDDLEFPWEPWTQQRPPSNSKYRRCYIRIGPRDNNATNNWAYVGGANGARLAIPIKMAQAGQIRLVQIAAYDADGNVFPVRFHFSLYKFQVSVQSMPQIPAAESYGPFRAPQRYPFGLNAWEKYEASGVLANPQIPQPATSGGLIRGWGDYYEKPGFWPGSEGAHDPVTGIYSDESVWSFDLTEFGNQFDPYTTKQKGPFTGMAYLMLYCDEQLDQPVYFCGRLYRVEPGATS